MRKFIISAVLGLCCLGALNVCAEGIGETNHTRFDLEWAFGRAVGINKNYGTAGFFYAPPNCFVDNCWCPQPFMDVRGHYIVNGKWAANAGVGVRSYDPSICRGWGAALYYDYRKGDLKGYSQVGLSLESLGSIWDFRLNGYLPVCGKGKTHERKHICLSDRSHSGDHRLHSERALAGAEAEIGAHLFRCMTACLEPFDLYVGAGPYCYAEHISRHHHQTWGGKIRAFLAFNEYVKLEVSASRDHMFKNNVQGVVTFEIPLDFNFTRDVLPDYDRRLLVQPVHRNDMVVLHNKYRY